MVARAKTAGLTGSSLVETAGSPSQFEALCSCLHNPTPHTRLQAATALGDYGVRALLPLAIALKDVEPEIRIAGVQAIGKIGTQNGISLLATALYDTELHVRVRAAEALGKLGDPLALEPLLAAYEDCFVGKSARVQQRLAPVEFVGYTATLAILTAQLGVTPHAALPLFLLWMVLLSGAIRRRQARSWYCRALMEALVTLGERDPHLPLRRLGAEFRAVAANPLQYLRSDREWARRAADRIEALPRTFHDLPGPASPIPVDSGALPLPVTGFSDYDNSDPSGNEVEP